jgi:hypothetical protein
MKGSGRGLFADLFQHLPGGTDENQEILIHNNWSLGRDLNPEPGKYEEQLNTSACDVQCLIRVNSR